MEPFDQDDLANRKNPIEITNTPEEIQSPPPPPPPSRKSAPNKRSKSKTHEIPVQIFCKPKPDLPKRKEPAKTPHPPSASVTPSSSPLYKNVQSKIKSQLQVDRSYQRIVNKATKSKESSLRASNEALGIREDPSILEYLTPMEIIDGFISDPLVKQFLTPPDFKRIHAIISKEEEEEEEEEECEETDEKSKQKEEKFRKQPLDSSWFQGMDSSSVSEGSDMIGIKSELLLVGNKGQEVEEKPSPTIIRRTSQLNLTLVSNKQSNN